MIVAGTDEVGVTALAGPITAVAYIPNAIMHRIEGVRDSKKLNEKERAHLFEKIVEAGILAVGQVDHLEADAIGRKNGSILAMERSVQNLHFEPDKVISDYYHINVPHNISFPKADDKHYEVSCASIVAKVLRDEMMARFSREYPQYLWHRNAGYPSRQHMLMILKHGLSPLHRPQMTRRSLETAQRKLREKEAWIMSVVEKMELEASELIAVNIEELIDAQASYAG